MIKITIIHHSADYDGLFCREIARKFLPPETEFIGWDFADKPLEVPPEGTIYILDLPVDRVFGLKFDVNGTMNYLPTSGSLAWLGRVIWIDHHASSIASHPTILYGYRIDGVAACRLAWQWFLVAAKMENGQLPCSDGLPGIFEFKDRRVVEPLAVQLAGEYDIWDHRGDGDLEFQFGLDSQPSIPWSALLDLGGDAWTKTEMIVSDGRAAMACYAKRDADVMRSRAFAVEFEGLKFLALNTAKCNSNTFASKDIPETGHDALMAFFWNGEKWNVSMYHAAHRKDLDLSKIAAKCGGGGHRGACGYRASTLPFIRDDAPAIIDGKAEELAGRMYDSYCSAVGGTDWRGIPLPGWIEFRADANKVKQSNGWVEAAKEAFK